MSEPREFCPQYCEHVMKRAGVRGTFEKRTFKSALGPGNASINHYLPCVLCTVIYPFWKTHVETPYVESGFDETKTEPFPFDSSNKGAIKVVLQKGQLGEAYHVLLCRLLHRWNRWSGLLDVTVEDLQNGEIPDLLRWYKVKFKLEKPRVDSQGKGSRGGFDSKKGATEHVTSTFKSCHSRLKRLKEPAIGEDQLAENTQQSVWPDQAAIFSCFRAMLDPVYGWPSENDNAARVVDIHADYLRPSYSAKYWLNRYLRLTNQKILPKKSGVTNLAVIHYRRDPETKVGRVMDKGTIKEVVDAIKTANARAVQAAEAPFSHVMLYGDFVSSEGLSFKKELMNAFGKSKSTAQHTKDSVEVFYVSRPWMPRGKESDEEDESETNAEVRLFWKKMRDPNFDPLPLQVKVLAIWVTLCQRYSPNICVIGHRSGFIEGAAFVGIPVFYLNNERLKATHEDPGDILWKPVGSQSPKRLQKLANFMNALIPMEVLVDNNGKKELDTKYKDELMAVLFTYMCCCLSPARYGDVSTVDNQPGWTARVEMMHDKREDHCCGSQCEDISTLEEAVEFLRHAVPKQASSQEPAEYEKDKELFRIEDVPKPVLHAASASTYRYEVLAINEFLRNREDKKCRKGLVDIFTDYCKVAAHRSRQTGQEWIRRRYRFAVKPSLEPGLLLQAWTTTSPIRALDKYKRAQKDDQRTSRASRALRTSGWPLGRHQTVLGLRVDFIPHKSTIYCVQKMVDYFGRNVALHGPSKLSFSKIPDEVRYACLHWIDHFAVEKVTDPWIVAHFLRKHFLHWVEALSVLRRLSDVEAMLDETKTEKPDENETPKPKDMLEELEATLENSPFLQNGRMPGIEDASDGPPLIDFIRDAKSYVQFNCFYIQQYPLGSHKAALLFAPLKSLIRQEFSHEVPIWDSGTGNSSGRGTGTSFLDSSSAHASIGTTITFSTDGSKVASMSRDKTLRLWDAVSGVSEPNFVGDLKNATSIVFSADEKGLELATNDTPVRFWDGGSKSVGFRMFGELPW